jgi:AraC-like DNA-binding protein
MVGAPAGKAWDGGVSAPPVEVRESGSGGLPETGEARLFYVLRGELEFEAGGSAWRVRHDRAIFVAGDTPVRTVSVSRATVVVVKFPRSIDRPTGPVAASPLMRAVMHKLVASARAPRRSLAAEDRLVAVLADEVTDLPVEPMAVPMPADQRLRALALRLQTDEGLRMTLADCSRVAGTSTRTLSRLVLRQTGLSFARWRRHLHLAAAMARLSAGESVNTVAYAAGYASPSAFITMFRRAVGMTPRQYAERALGRATVSRQELNAEGTSLPPADAELPI